MGDVPTTEMSADEFHDWWNEVEDEDRKFELDRGRVVERRPFGTE